MESTWYKSKLFERMAMPVASQNLTPLFKQIAKAARADRKKSDEELLDDVAMSLLATAKSDYCQLDECQVAFRLFARLHQRVHDEAPE